MSNDLLVDQRVHKSALSLTKFGFHVLVLGRRFRESKEIEQRMYPVQRLRVFFRNGPLYYFELNLRFFIYLVFNRVKILLANDLDTLPACYFAARIIKCKLVYDSHEYFSEVPELVGHPLKKKIWSALERRMLPKVNSFYTVNRSLADVFSEKYKRPVGFVRNMPLYDQKRPISTNANFDKKIILYQGSVNVGRGLEEMIRAMSFLPEFSLWIVGEGDVLEDLRILVEKLKIPGRVKYFGRVPFDRLKEISRKASLGISLEKNLGLNYFYALPNKIFDYIHAGVPVLVSDLPEMKQIVTDYQVGRIAESHDPEKIAGLIQDIFSKKEDYESFVHNCAIAARELNWQNEEKRLIKYFTFPA